MVFGERTAPNPKQDDAQLLCGKRKNRRKINSLEEEGARWPHRSSKPAWRLILLPEGSTPSPLRQCIFCAARGEEPLARHTVTVFPLKLVKVNPVQFSLYRCA